MAEFYSLNPKLIMRYQPFLAKRQEKFVEEAHFDGWVFGQYFASSIGTNFSKRAKYPKQPLYMMQMDIDEETEQHVLTDAERFQMWAIAFNGSHKELEVVDAKASERPDGTIVAEPVRADASIPHDE